MRSLPWITFIAALTLLGAARLPAAEIHLFAAASLTESLQEIAARYEKQSGDRVLFNLGASSMLARQIEEGAPADVFFSADESKMDALAQRDLIIKATRKSRLSNSLVIITTPETSPIIGSPKDLADPRIKRLALADPKAVPAGIYAKRYLEKLNLWPALEKKVVPTENVRAALAAVESGNVEAGMVYKTDAAISKKVRVAFEVPPAEGPEISYSVTVLKDSRQSESAKKFVVYLDSPHAASVFKRFGFIVRE